MAFVRVDAPLRQGGAGQSLLVESHRSILCPSWDPCTFVLEPTLTVEEFTSRKLPKWRELTTEEILSTKDRELLKLDRVETGPRYHVWTLSNAASFSALASARDWTGLWDPAEEEVPPDHLKEAEEGWHAEGGLGPPTSTPESGKTPLRDCRERWPHHSLGPSPSLRLAELPHERGGIASPPFLGFRARRGLPRAAGCSFGACRRKSLRSRGDPSKRSAALSALRSSKCRSPACAAAAAVSGRAALASVASLALGRSPVRGSGFSWSSPWPGVCLQGGC